ncbi:MAG: alpha/beta fold hydrolase [Bacteroidota bacterium]
MNRFYWISLLTIWVLNQNLAQESAIIRMEKVDWQAEPKLFVDEAKTVFQPTYEFLSSVEMYEFTYLSDGLKIEDFAAVPKKAGKFPVIVYNRGGNRDYGALVLYRNGQNFKYPVSYHFSKLANEGFVVVGCNYRGCGNSEGQDEFGGRDVNDVVNLVDLLAEIPKADTAKIGMYGWSRGGTMTYQSLIRTDNIKAAVVGGGPTDITTIDRPNMEKNVLAKLIPNYWENREAELKKRSAYYFVDQFSKNVPLLILHGNADWRVKSRHALQLAVKLDELRLPYRLKIFEGGDHGLSAFVEERDADVVNWFKRYLQESEAVPNMAFPNN